MATGAALGGFEIEHLPTTSLSWTSAVVISLSLLFAVLFALKSSQKTKEAMQKHAKEIIA
jgi:predicted MFS family arabinose efflux permease